MASSNCGECNICNQTVGLTYVYPLPKELEFPIHWGLKLCQKCVTLLNTDIKSFKEALIAGDQHHRQKRKEM